MKTEKRNIYLIIGLFITATLTVCTSGCSKKNPVKIGFVGGITGRVADLGIAGRDGAILAVEQANKAGGIDGKEIVLVVKDDEQNPDTARKVVNELIQEKVAAIIGHMTSSMSMVSVPVINKNKILMLSPTTSTNDLNGKDDYFFRIYPYSAQTSSLLAEHVYKSMGHKTAFVVYDITNRAHTQSAYDYFKKAFEQHGGKMVGEVTFLSGPDVSFSEIAKQITAKKPDCLYLLANAMDTAMLCQQLLKLKFKIQIVTSDWSATEDVIQYGGKSVEGMFFYYSVDKHSKSPSYLGFKETFTERFGREPDFACIHSYDCARILISALIKNQDPSKLPETIKSIKTFDGLQSQISFDENGDVVRKHFPCRIKDGRFEAIVTHE